MEERGNPFSRHSTNLFRGLGESAPPFSALLDIAHEYNRNTRYYNDNIRDYNQNMREIINFMYNNRNDNARAPAFDISMNMSFWEFPLSNAVRPRVPVHLSREQIARNTRTYGYTDEMHTLDADMNEHMCPISLEHFQVGDVICEIQGCGHKFKRPPLMNWLRRNSRCPVCRYDILANDNTETRQNNESNENSPIVEEAPREAALQASLSEILQNFITNSIDASGNVVFPES